MKNLSLKKMKILPIILILVAGLLIIFTMAITIPNYYFDWAIISFADLQSTNEVSARYLSLLLSEADGPLHILISDHPWLDSGVKILIINLKEGMEEEYEILCDNNLRMLHIETANYNDSVENNTNRITRLLCTMRGGDDIFYGNGGNDIFSSYGALDRTRLELNGGIGNDILLGGNANDRIDGKDGNDTIIGWNGNDNLFGQGQNDFISGGDGDDNIEGGSGTDTLNGGRDDDDIDGGPGEDTLFGEHGNDGLYGKGGDDRLLGGIGSDSLNGGRDDDSLTGNSGSDVLRGKAGHDRLKGGAGSDNLSGYTGKDCLHGNDDTDTDNLDGGPQIDWLYCGSSDTFVSDSEDVVSTSE